MQTRNILVIRGGAIGDFILTLPVLTALRAHVPGARLEVLGSPAIASLARLGGLADDVRSLESRSMAGFFAGTERLDAGMAAYFGGFDLILSYLFDPAGQLERNVARCSKARYIAGPHRPDETLDVHAAQCLLKPLERLGIFNADPVPRLPSIRGASGNLASAGSGVTELAVHPGSGSARKNWSESRWGGFLERLAEATGVNVLLVGGEAEGGKLDRLASRIPKPRMELARSLPLPDLAVRLSRCGAFMGHDSGITHLAAAVGLPSLVLWGETAEAVWRPLGASVQILRHDRGLEGLSVEMVWERWTAWMAWMV